MNLRCCTPDRLGELAATMPRNLSFAGSLTTRLHPCDTMCETHYFAAMLNIKRRGACMLCTVTSWCNVSQHQKILASFVMYLKRAGELNNKL